MALSIFLAYDLSGYGLNQCGDILVELNLLFMIGAMALFFIGY